MNVDKIIVGTSAVLGLVSIAGSLIVLGILFQVNFPSSNSFLLFSPFKDINSLYENVQLDMRQFRILANDTWQGMIQMERAAMANGNEGNSLAQPFRSIFGRNKRQGEIEFIQNEIILFFIS
jgi:hypothetical protein